MTSWGLLLPAQVDPDSGYRWYAAGQLDNARLVTSLRQIGVPLAQIQLIVSLEPEAAAAPRQHCSWLWPRPRTPTSPKSKPRTCR
jgi:DNA-binding transcriptional MerR regulator